MRSLLDRNHVKLRINVSGKAHSIQDVDVSLAGITCLFYDAFGTQPRPLLNLQAEQRFQHSVGMLAE